MNIRVSYHVKRSTDPLFISNLPLNKRICYWIRHWFMKCKHIRLRKKSPPAQYCQVPIEIEFKEQKQLVVLQLDSTVGNCLKNTMEVSSKIPLHSQHHRTTTSFWVEKPTSHLNTDHSPLSYSSSSVGGGGGLWGGSGWTPPQTCLGWGKRNLLPDQSFTTGPSWLVFFLGGGGSFPLCSSLHQEGWGCFLSAPVHHGMGHPFNRLTHMTENFTLPHTMYMVSN